MRLNQFLASAGLGSRRSCEEIILSGKVSINGHFVKDLATRVQPEDRVEVEGKSLSTQRAMTILLNKPKGIISSTVDEQNTRDTVFDLLPKHFPRLFYVGRLDVDTEGMLILTNQGQLAQELAHPRYKLPKTYIVQLDKPFDFDQVEKLKKGFMIEPGFARMEAVYKLSPYELKVVLHQGLKRQIRLMFYHLGYEVNQLKRIQIGGLELGSLKPGEWRHLGEEDMQKLKKVPAKFSRPSEPSDMSEETPSPQESPESEFKSDSGLEKKPHHSFEKRSGFEKRPRREFNKSSGFKRRPRREFDQGSNFNAEGSPSSEQRPFRKKFGGPKFGSKPGFKRGPRRDFDQRPQFDSNQSPQSEQGSDQNFERKPRREFNKGGVDFGWKAKPSFGSAGRPPRLGGYNKSQDFEKRPRRQFNQSSDFNAEGSSSSEQRPFRKKFGGPKFGSKPSFSKGPRRSFEKRSDFGGDSQSSSEQRPRKNFHKKKFGSKPPFRKNK